MDKLKTFFLYSTIFLTGATVLIVEILGTRILAPFYGSTIYVWSSMISAALGFLALGYWLGGKAADKVISQGITFFYSSVRTPESLLAAVIFSAGAGLMLIPKVDALVLMLTDPLGVRFGPLAAAVILFSIPLFLLGMIAPIAIKYQTQKLEVLGAKSGGIFAFSTLGSLAGAILAGFYFVPNFSITIILNSAGVLLIVLSVLWLRKNPVRKSLPAIGVLLAALFLIPSYQVSASQEASILYQEPSFFGTIKIYEVNRPRQHIRCLMIDATTQSCWNYEMNSSAWMYTRYLRSAALLLPEKPSLDILMIGLGGGSALKEMADTAHRIDVVEIDRKVLRIAEDFLDLPKGTNIRYIVDDGRSFLRRSPKHYDVIMTDVALNANSAAHLLTKEFFEEAKGKLKKGGVLAINSSGWVTSQKLHPMLYQTLSDVFAYVKFTASNPEGAGAIVYFAREEDFEETGFRGQIPNLYDADFLADRFLRASGQLITDDYNPVAILDLPMVAYVRDNTKKTYGKELYLYDPS